MSCDSAGSSIRLSLLLTADGKASSSMEKKRKLDRVSSSSSEVSAEPVPKPSESVKVALLIRPLLADERAAGQNVCLRKVEGKPEVALDGAGGFKFDHVSGPDEPVDVVFERCVLNSILANVLQGFNGTVLAYGQTRSGKTHAMGSGALRGAPSGLIQLAVAALFERLPEGTTVHASFTQIYCEEVHDLLNCSKDGDLATLPIKGSTATGYSLPTAERVLVSSLEDVMAAIARGAANRATGATKMNAHSSRCAQFLSARNSSRRAILGAQSSDAVPVLSRTQVPRDSVPRTRDSRPDAGGGGGRDAAAEAPVCRPRRLGAHEARGHERPVAARGDPDQPLASLPRRRRAGALEGPGLCAVQPLVADEDPAGEPPPPALPPLRLPPRLRPHRRLRLRLTRRPRRPLPPAGLARRQLADRDARAPRPPTSMRSRRCRRCTPSARLV